MKIPLLIAAVALLGAQAYAQSAPPSTSDPSVFLTVNGQPLRRNDIINRLWAQHADDMIGQMVDEMLIAQAAAAHKVSADAKEVDARLKRIQSQFPDEATFKQRLAATGSSLEALKARITDQVLRENLVVAAKNLSMSDAELKQYFDTNKDKLGAPPAVHVRRILVATQKEAEDFEIALHTGAGFVTLARAVSLDKSNKDKGGEIGWISRGMLQPEIEKLVFSMRPNMASDPVPSPDGFQLFLIDDQRPAKPAVFKDIQKDLRQALIADRISKAWPGYLQELRKQAKVVQSPN